MSYQTFVNSMSDSDSDYSSSSNDRSGRNHRKVKYLTPRKYRVRTRSAISNAFSVDRSPYASLSEDDDDDDRSSQRTVEYTITPTKYAKNKVVVSKNDDSFASETSTPIVRGEFILKSKPNDDTSFYNYKPKSLFESFSYTTMLTGQQAQERAENEMKTYDQQRNRSYTPIFSADNRPSGATTPRPANIDQDNYSPNPSNQRATNVNPSLNTMTENDYLSTPPKPSRSSTDERDRRATYTSLLYDQPLASYATGSKLLYNFGPGASTETSVVVEEDELSDDEQSEQTLVRMPRGVLDTVDEESDYPELDQDNFGKVTDVGTGTQIDEIFPSNDESDQAYAYPVANNPKSAAMYQPSVVGYDETEEDETEDGETDEADGYPVVNYPKSAAMYQPSIVRYDETEESDSGTLESSSNPASEEKDDVGQTYRVNDRSAEMSRSVGVMVMKSPLRTSQLQRSGTSEGSVDSRSSRESIPPQKPKKKPKKSSGGFMNIFSRCRSDRSNE